MAGAGIDQVYYWDGSQRTSGTWTRLGVWKGLPDVSLSEDAKRCSGGKQSKQRNTWAFFVNAAGGEEDPVIIGHAVQPRCFKHLKYRKRPYGCYYFSNKKAWMTNDIMDNILSSLNQRLQRAQRNIMLFLDNAPCHSTNLMLFSSSSNIYTANANITL